MIMAMFRRLLRARLRLDVGPLRAVLCGLDGIEITFAVHFAIRLCEKLQSSGKDYSHAIDISLVTSGAQVGW